MTSAFLTVPIGTLREIKGKTYCLSNKWQTKVHVCPHCGSKKTFHGERIKTFKEHPKLFGKEYENNSRMFKWEWGGSYVLHKYDLCLDCGREWVMEVFCWEKTEKVKK